MALSPVLDQSALSECCASERWTEQMLAGCPYASTEALLDASERAFDALAADDWLEAFAAHARIGEPKPGDRRGSSEQAGAARADPGTLEALKRANAEYEERFGHVFLIRAAGRSAQELLAALRERMHNPPEVELQNAARQQREITRLRLLNLTR